MDDRRLDGADGLLQAPPRASIRTFPDCGGPAHLIFVSDFTPDQNRRMTPTATAQAWRTKSLLSRMDVDAEQAAHFQERLAGLQARLLGKG